MFENLHLDHYAIGVPFIFVATALVFWAEKVVHECIGRERLKKTHDVAGHYLALVGTFYAVLLGLVVFDAMSKFQETEKTVEGEARSALTVYVLSEQFPTYSPYIKPLINAYTDEVIDHELKMMENGEVSEKARNIMLTLVHLIKEIKPTDENQQAVFPVLLQETINWWEKRRDRLRESMFGIPAAEWTVLIVGALITITFTFFFTTNMRGIDVLMRSLASILIAMSLYLVLLFGSPFSGDMKVSDKPYRFLRTAVNFYLKK